MSAGTIGLGGVRVSTAAGSTTTDADGRFVVDAPAGRRVAVDVGGAAGSGAVFSSTQALVDVGLGAESNVVVELLPGCAVVVDGASGVVAPRSCGLVDGVAGVRLPPNGVVDADGDVVASVRVEMTPLPVVIGGRRAPDVMAAFPGDLEATDEAGASAFLESLGAVEIRLFDAASGDEAFLAAGRTATLQFPASPDAIEDEVIRAWFYDVDRRRWIEEGAGSVTVDPASGALMNTFEVEHFTWWNADRAVERSCVEGRVVSANGVPLARASLTTTGVDYLGVTGATSEADGTFSIFGRASSSIELAGAVLVDGDVVRSRPRPLITGVASDTDCLQVGDVVIDEADALGCLRGRVESNGTAIADATVAAHGGTRTFSATSGADGGFCLDVRRNLAVDVTAAGRNGAVLVRGHRSDLGTTTGGVSCAAAAACVDVGVVEAAPLTCLTGRVVGENGGVADAVVVADGFKGHTSAVSGAGGDYCLTVEQEDVVDLFATRGTGLLRKTAEINDVFTLSTPSTCATPLDCLEFDLVLDDLTCLRGETRDAAGAVLAGVTVSAVDVRGGRSRSVVSDSGGDFCLPVAQLNEVEISFSRVDATRRFFARGTFTPDSSEALCSSTGCTDIGEINLTASSLAGCLVGRFGSPDRPHNDPVNLLLGGRAVAVIRPREDGRFCIEAGLAEGLVLSDPIESSSCVRREAEVDALVDTLLLDGSCADEDSCTDIGDLDFADFCATS